MDDNLGGEDAFDFMSSDSDLGILSEDDSDMIRSLELLENKKETKS